MINELMINEFMINELMIMLLAWLSFFRKPLTSPNVTFMISSVNGVSELTKNLGIAPAGPLALVEYFGTF